MAWASVKPQYTDWQKKGRMFNLFSSYYMPCMKKSLTYKSYGDLKVCVLPYKEWRSEWGLCTYNRTKKDVRDSDLGEFTQY